MGRPRGYSAGPDLNALDDGQMEELVLSNWAKLNQVLKHGLTLLDVQRLMMLELSKGKRARPMILKRLRSALSKLHSAKAASALEEIVVCIKGKEPMPHGIELRETIQEVGLTGVQYWTVQDSWRKQNEE